MKYTANCTGMDYYRATASPPDTSGPFGVSHPGIEGAGEASHASRLFHDYLLIIMLVY